MLIPSQTGTPLITVVLPTLNCARYLAEAIESVLAQSCDDFELVVADGGSTDATIGIVKAYAALDRRVRIECFPGLHPTRRVDLCISKSSARYIAMQHADDISYTHRLARQLEAFGDDPHLAVCSTAYRSFWHVRNTGSDQEGIVVHKKPVSHEQIKPQLLFWWVMHSPTLMLDRHKIQSQGLCFENEFQFINDYWQTVSNIGQLRYHNLPDELSAYRLHSLSDGPRHLDQLLAEQHRVKEKILGHFGFTFTPEQLRIHCAIRLLPDRELLFSEADDYRKALAWLDSLRSQNERLSAFNPQIFKALLDDLRTQIKRHRQYALLRRVVATIKRHL